MPDSPDAAPPTTTTHRRPADARATLRTVLRGLLRIAAALSAVGVTLMYAVHFTLRIQGGDGIPADVLQAVTLYAALVAIPGGVDVVVASHSRESVDRVAADRAAELADLRVAVAALQEVQSAVLDELRRMPTGAGEVLDRLAERIGELAEEAGERSDGEFLRGVQATVDGMRGDAGSVSTLNQRAPRQRMPGRVGGPGAPVVHP